MTGTLGWGILGTGLIAGIFTEDLRRAGLRVTAVGSRTESSARAFAHAHDVPHAHGDYAGLVTDPSVDIVYVATPNSLHLEHALLAIGAGKHVLVEKPFALNAAQAREIATAATTAGVSAMEAMWTRFLPHMGRVRELARGGALGDVRAVLADHGQFLSTDPAHRVNTAALGGGALLDLGVYPLAFAIDLLGAPERTLAHAHLTGTGVDGQTAVLTVHAGGRQGVSYSGLATPSAVRASVIGTEARIEIDPWWYNATSFSVVAPDGSVRERFSMEVAGRGMQYEAIEFERIIRAELPESPLMPLGETIELAVTMDEIRSQIGVVFPGD
ncbi:MAG: Gfo/Idh/MocA family oxidoreductase [Tessaracoccus sp.]|uniref:Gfo/Idh/MocA family protein n=1 Tax=Tessaracoccus sp. TaxID=1971211 RepID=UPI001ED14656|nr:Gfo/Idh/MocA family oxidoreductase [Tessaracoccus sp.]MBK7821730.1 Gfo/Idh/MocA family oxidoreductase [Tessaracoccus sp.]